MTAAREKLKKLSHAHSTATPCDLWSRHTIRLQIAFLLSAMMAICGLFRGQLGMALVCIMKIDKNASYYVPDDSYTSSLQVEWSLRDVGTIHTSFYIGTFISVLVAHNLAQKIGAKATITGGIIINIMATWCFPTLVYFLPNYYYTAGLRFIMGLGQGVFIPCASLLIAKWFPMHEKSTAMAIFSTGNQVGLALAMFATAELCKVRYLDGWPTSFFLYGLIGAAFIGIWLPNVKNKPRASRWISTSELLHIEESEQRLRAMSINLNVPYKTLFCSPVIVAICLSSFCQSFVMVTFISYMPEYYRSVLKLGISANGQLSAFPFLIQMFSKMGFAFGADRLKMMGLGINFVTKASNSIASFGCAICLLLICFTHNGTIILLLLCLGLTLTSAFVPGYNTSIVSIAPSYTAVISAYAQVYAQVGSILAPLIVGFITQNSSVNEWRIVFFIISCVCCFTGVVFQLFGSATVQPWAIPHYQNKMNASTFTVHMANSELSLNVNPTLVTLPHLEDDDDDPDGTPRTSLLLVAPSSRKSRSPRVSIMDEDGEITIPGEELPVLKKISEEH